MKYNLENNIDKDRFTTRANFLFKNKKYVELKELKLKRTNQQNRYLHLIIALFAYTYGEKADYVKLEIFKKVCNSEIFKTEYVNKKTGEIREMWKSSSDIDTKEMTIAITRFRNYSSQEAGIYLPSANEHDYLKEIEIEIERYKEYL